MSTGSGRLAVCLAGLLMLALALQELHDLVLTDRHGFPPLQWCWLAVLVAGPDAGELAGALGGAALDRGLHDGEDRALQGGGYEDLP
jgi:hypothetical protein